MNNQGLIVGVLVLVVVVIAGWFLLANRSDAPAVVPGSEEDITAEEYSGGVPLGTGVPAVVSASPAAAPAATVQEFKVAASEFKFSPSEIRVKKGDTVRVVLTNSGAMPHDWKVDEFGAATKVISPGQTDTVEFVADEAGTFESYCSVGQHRANGMVGKLIVE